MLFLKTLSIFKIKCWHLWIWVNIGSGNGLLPDGTKPLPEPMLTDYQWSPVTFILETQPSITQICLKITCLKFHSNFPGANELIKEQPQNWLCCMFPATTVCVTTASKPSVKSRSQWRTTATTPCRPDTSIITPSSRTKVLHSKVIVPSSL